MAKKKIDEEYRDREWYMHRCDNLRYENKKLRETLGEFKSGLTEDEHFQKLKQELADEKKTSNYLRSEICRLKQRMDGTDKQKEINKRLKKENESNKVHKTKYLACLTENKKLQLENGTLKDTLKTLVTKNKRVLGTYYHKAQEQEDGWRISFATVLLDFEFMFIFQKLFEMHVFDYIVDRQNPDNKTEYDTKQLVQTCKEWTDEIIKNQIYHITLKPDEFKKAFKTFTQNHVEPAWMKREKKDERQEENESISV